MLAVTDNLARHRRLTTSRATQLTYDVMRAPAIDVDLLTRKRRAPAVDADVPIGLERTEATLQKDALQLLHMGDDRGHDDIGFRGAWTGSCLGNRACADASSTVRLRFVASGNYGWHGHGLVCRYILLSGIQVHIDKLVMIVTSSPGKGAPP